MTMKQGDNMDIVERLALSIRETAEQLGVCERTVHTLIARGELRTRRIGRRRVVLVSELENFLRRDHKTGDAKAGACRLGRGADPARRDHATDKGAQ